MLEALKNLGYTLCAVVVLGSVCEMILPNGVYKKYIHLTIGLLFIISLIKPIMNIDENNLDISTAFASATDDTERECGFKSDVIKVYKRKIEDKIEKELLVDANVNCKICDKEENFGYIENIYITVDAKGEAKIPDATILKLKESYGENITVKYLR